MSVFLHVTLEIHAGGLSRFMTAMEQTALPFLEGQGWKLRGAFVQRTGRLGNVIDLWELEDFQHYDRAIQKLYGHPQFPEIKTVLAETVISETVVFCNPASYMHPKP